MAASYMITHTRRGPATTTELLHQHNNKLRGLRADWPRQTAGRAGCLRMMKGRLMNTTSPGSGRRTTSLKHQQVNWYSQYVHFKCVCAFFFITNLLYLSVWPQFSLKGQRGSARELRRSRPGSPRQALHRPQPTQLRYVWLATPLLSWEREWIHLCHWRDKCKLTSAMFKDSASVSNGLSHFIGQQ